MLSRIVLFFSIVTALALAGCSAGGSTDPDTVVAAFYPIAYAAEQISGGGVPVRNLTPAGAEPHDLELTPGDVRAIHDASVVLYFGDGFMPGLETAVRDRDGRSVDLLAQLRLQESGGAPGDPHVWLDPVRYAALVRLIGKALHDDAGTTALTRKLAQLDRDYRTGLANCERRQIVTSHAAFGYLARRYGLEQVPLEGLTPEAEPSAKDIEGLVERVRSSGATTVFFEPLISPKLAQTVAREADVGTADLDPLEGLSDERIVGGADYFSVMRDNLATLRKALGCR
jgi:zinc transport system substrate-binding protein